MKSSSCPKSITGSPLSLNDYRKAVRSLDHYYTQRSGGKRFATQKEETGAVSTCSRSWATSGEFEAQVLQWVKTLESRSLTWWMLKPDQRFPRLVVYFERLLIQHLAEFILLPAT